MGKKRKYSKDSKVNSKPSKRTAMDAFSNVLARLGAGTSNLLESTDYPMTRLTQNFQLMNSLYRSHWIVRKVIDCIPEDMCKNWFTIKSQLKPEALKRLDTLQRTARVQRDILEGLKWGRLYGGAGAVIIIDGHEDILDQKLDYDMIMPGSFKGMIVTDRWCGLTPGDEIIEDLGDPDFGLPEYYYWSTETGDNVIVHHSRVLRFIGRELPNWEKYAEQQWGASDVEVIFDELKKRDNTSWNIAQLVFLANLRVLKMADLGELLAIGDEEAKKDLYNTIQAQNWLMSNMGMYILNEKDGFETHQYSFSGLNDIYESFMLDVAGAAEIPVTRLFGRSPAGFNATGESDMKNYYDLIEQKQESQLRPVLDKLVPIMFMSEFGAIPDDLDYEFNPIGSPSEDELSNIVDKKTNSIINVFNAGLISQKTSLKELRQMSESTGMFTNITDEDIANADDDIDPTGDMPEDDNDINFNLPLGDMLPATDGGKGSGNFGHQGRPGEIGGSGEGGGSGSEAEKDCILKNCSKEIQRIYDNNRKNEKVITPVMNDIAKELNSKMYGLEFSVKTASSVEDKIARKKKIGFTEKEAIESMGDIVRYTQLCEHDKIANNTLKTIEILTEKGYDVIEIDNKYLDTISDYKGVHINAISPEGQKFELQIHSEESMDVKNKIHPLYEEARNVNTSKERSKELSQIMKNISSKLPKPKDIDNIKNYKKG
ncbi:TPA: anti-CBASS protein Acb1 family protein [Clostridium botulinum]|uniref:phage portal protein n=1 Tax=Clostridium botulinum TaxID=1491 RepID=UPI00035BA6C6|nr:DUF1073 domain-containing protein [Clostridium botulinum]EPS56758.1 phage-associated protein, HI1409 family [Clostridium botulinum Af84]